MESFRRRRSNSNVAKMSISSNLSTVRLEHKVRQEKKVLSEIEQKLKNWKLPKFHKKDVYKKGVFEFGSDNTINTEEQTIYLDQEFTKMKLLPRHAIMRHRQNYNCLHFGLVQIGIKPVTEEGLKASALVALRDGRYLNFPDSLLGIVESSLCNGPIFFNSFPDYCVSLEDLHILERLTLNVKVHGCNMQPGNPAVAITYRVRYKVMETPFEDAKAVKCDPPGETLLLETNIHKAKNTIVARIIQWDEIEVPDEWRRVEEGDSSNIVRGQNQALRPLPRYSLVADGDTLKFVTDQTD